MPQLAITIKLWKVAASNINIKIQHLFSNQQILGVHLTVVLRKILGDLTQTSF